MKISSEQLQSNADIKINIAANHAVINEVPFYMLLENALFGVTFLREYFNDVLYVTDVSVIPDRKHKRDYDHTIEISKLCIFPHIQFR